MSREESFAQRLTKLIQERNISHAEVGRTVGVSGQAVGKWAKGGNIEYDNLQALAKLFGVNWIWLRYGDDAMISFSERRTGSKARRTVIRDIMESEERLRRALDVADIGVWELDLISDQLMMSAVASRLLGMGMGRFQGTKEDLLGYVHREDRERLDEALGQVLDNRVQSLDLTYRVTGGTGRVRQRGKIITDDLGRAVRVLGVISINE
jgi:PAS domain-containing protein